MWKVIIAFQIILLNLQISVHGQEFFLGGQSYPNHGLVLREDIGETDTSDLDPNNGLSCVSFSGCCDSGGLRGEFYFPGSTIQVPVLGNLGSNGYYRNRVADRIFLNRQLSGTITGIFECRIRTESSQTSYQPFYIGVYDADSGSPSISGSISYSSANQTLTCTSTGGPATSIIWRQNCVVLQKNDSNYAQSQTVTNTQTATYENTVVISRAVSDGVYTCSVHNSRGSASSSVGIGTDYSPALPIDVVITSSSDTPVAGQSFTLTCQASTTLMNPTYQWFDDSGRMVGSGSTLTLNPLIESNSGEYSCQVAAGSGAGQRFGCGVTRVTVQVPTLTVTVNNVTTAVAGLGHTLSCSVSGANLETATVMYTWKLNNAVIHGPSISNLYNIASDINPIQVSDAGEVYSCEVTVTGASYWDVSRSFEGSGSGILSVSIPSPTVQFTRLTLGTVYVGLNFTWRCEVELPGRQLSGVRASVEWIGSNGAVLISDGRITVGATLETSPGREYQKSLSFTPLSAGDSGSYSCSATVMPTTSNSLVMNAVRTGSDSLSVASTTLAVNVDRSSVPTRVLDLPAFNGFSLTCRATSRADNQEVAVTKSITWMRNVDGGNPQLLTDSDMSTSDNIVMISSADLQMATAMSMLMVNTTVAGSHVYTCSANLSILPALDNIRSESMTTIVVQGVTSPNPPMRLLAHNIRHNIATIQWTVTSLSYGPETYVVQYGKDMNNLNETSSMETSGGDITRTNFYLSVGLTSLQISTTYFYRVIAMNDGIGATQSDIGTFNTTGLGPEPPNMFEGVASTNPTESPTIAFTWLSPNVTNGDVVDYRVTCSPELEGIATSSVTSLTTSATVSDLENGVQYCCTVTARNVAGTSLPSMSHCFSTVAIAPTGKPQSFRMVVINSRTVTFTWQLPAPTERNGLITNYNLTCVNTTNALTRIYSAAESDSYILTGFKANAAYTCRVFAINSDGSGPTANLTLTTQQDRPDGPPQDITFSLVTSSPSQVSFNFNPPRKDLQNGLITHYRISCVDHSRTRAAVSEVILASEPRPYTFSDLIPATMYDCSLSARTSVGYGVEAMLEILTMPDKLTMISITPDRRSLLVIWNYTNPSLSEGAVISGYHVYLDGQRVRELSSSSMSQFNITSLSPFTNYTIEVSAYNTRGDGVQQEGHRSDTMTITTMEDVPGPPVCEQRWQSAALNSLRVSWSRPHNENGKISAYFIQLVRYNSSKVIFTSSLTDLSSQLSQTLNNLSLASGVPYDVRIFAENRAGNGSFCTVSDFGDEETPPDIVYDSVKITRIGDGRTARFSWTVLPLDVVRGNIRLRIEFPSSNRKRQAGATECNMSGCLVPYEQGGVNMTGLEPNKVISFNIRALNEEGEIATVALIYTSNVCSEPRAGSNINSAAVIGLAAVIAVLVLLLLLSVSVNVVLFIQRSKSKQTRRFPAEGIGSENVDIMTSQCEAYEVVKMKDQPRGAGRTTSVAAAGSDQAYEEVRKGLSHRIGRGQETTATPQQEQTIQQMYAEVSHDTVKKNPSSARRRAEPSHYD